MKSILNDLLKEVMQIKSLQEAKLLIVEKIESTKIKDEDKKRMLFEINNQTNLTKLQSYCCNLVFKYEGLGVSEYKNIK